MDTLLTESMISGFSSSGFYDFWLLQGSSGPAGNFRQNGTQLVLLEYHARPPEADGTLCPFALELEVSRRSARTAVSARGWEQTHHAPQILPRGLVQRWVCADQVADHLPRGDVECAFWRRAQSQRD